MYQWAFVILIFSTVWPSFVLAQNISIWEHNGSTVKIEAEGNRRKIYYVEPRAGLPAKAGELLFEGERKGTTYTGTAYLFSKQCGPIPYAVAGLVSDGDKRITMRGTAPRRSPQCSITGYFEDTLDFRFVALANKTESVHNNYRLNDIDLNKIISEKQLSPFKCQPSDTYTNLLFCTLSERSSAKPDQTTTSIILTANERRVLYISVSFPINTPSNLQSELNIAVSELGPPTATSEYTNSRDGERALLSTWGNIELAELGQSILQNIKEGKPSGMGVLFDILGNFKRSAESEMPIFSFRAGRGMIWRAVKDQRGRGNIRVVAVDASLLEQYRNLPNGTLNPTTPNQQNTIPESSEISKAAEQQKLEAERLRKEAEELKEKAAALLKEEEEKKRLREAEEIEQKNIENQANMLLAKQTIESAPYIEMINACENGSYSKRRIRDAATIRERGEIKTVLPFECRCLAFETARDDQGGIKENYQRIKDVLSNEISDTNYKLLQLKIIDCSKRNIPELRAAK